MVPSLAVFFLPRSTNICTRGLLDPAKNDVWEFPESHHGPASIKILHDFRRERARVCKTVPGWKQTRALDPPSHTHRAPDRLFRGDAKKHEICCDDGCVCVCAHEVYKAKSPGLTPATWRIAPIDAAEPVAAAASCVCVTKVAKYRLRGRLAAARRSRRMEINPYGKKRFCSLQPALCCCCRAK